MAYVSSFDGTQIYYEHLNKKSKKPLLVFIHGWVTNWTVLRWEIDFFHRQRYPIIYLDLRGHGLSGKPQEPEKYHVRLLARDLEAILKKERVKRKLIIIGYSLGAMVALSFYSMFPTSVEKLVLISATYKDPFKTSFIKGIDRVEHFIKHLLNFLLGNKRVRNKHMKHLREIDYSKLTRKSDIQILLKGLLNTPLASVIGCLEAMFDYNVSNSMKDIKIPTLIVSGRRDQIFPIKIPLTIHRDIKKSYLKITRGSHMLVVKQPREVSEAIYYFIK